MDSKSTVAAAQAFAESLGTYLLVALAVGSVFYLTTTGKVAAGDYLALIGPLLGGGGVHAIYRARSKSPSPQQLPQPEQTP